MCVRSALCLHADPALSLYWSSLILVPLGCAVHRGKSLEVSWLFLFLMCVYFNLKDRPHGSDQLQFQGPARAIEAYCIIQRRVTGGGSTIDGIAYASFEGPASGEIYSYLCFSAAGAFRHSMLRFRSTFASTNVVRAYTVFSFRFFSRPDFIQEVTCMRSTYCSRFKSFPSHFRAREIILST